MIGTLIGIGFLLVLYIGYLNSRIEQENRIAQSYVRQIIELQEKLNEKELEVKELYKEILESNKKEKNKNQNPKSSFDFDDIVAF